MTLASTFAAASATKPAPCALIKRRLLLGLLGAVDVGPGRAVDHGARALPRDHPLDPGRVRDVEVVVGQRDHLVTHVLGDPDDVLAEHPVRLP